jgi:hypothetical protein
VRFRGVARPIQHDAIGRYWVHGLFHCTPTRRHCHTFTRLADGVQRSFRGETVPGRDLDDRELSRIEGCFGYRRFVDESNGQAVYERGFLLVAERDVRVVRCRDNRTTVIDSEPAYAKVSLMGRVALWSGDESGARAYDIRTRRTYGWRVPGGGRFAANAFHAAHRVFLGVSLEEEFDPPFQVYRARLAH